MAESNFVDYVKIFCRSGKGGRGSAHLRHDKYIPNGGPDGGDGGKGGSVILKGNRNYWTLLHLRYERHAFAENGGNGGSNKCFGKDGNDVIIEVPCGTVAYDAETGEYLRSRHIVTNAMAIRCGCQKRKAARFVSVAACSSIRWISLFL